MNIAILNGSPKKDVSVTMQFIKFLELSFPEHNFRYVHASHYCGKMEKDEKYFDGVMDVIAQADAVLWAFPLYYLLVQSQYKRFIELIFERGRMEVFRDKYAAALSTSIHFFDHTAHNYIRGICDDMEMRYVDFFPAKMHDLNSGDKRKALIYFFTRFISHAQRNLPAERAFSPLRDHDFKYVPGAMETATGTVGGKAAVVAVYDHDRPNVETLARRMASQFSRCELVDVGSLKMGHCLGCLKCGFDNRCAYDGKDEFIPVLKERILTADIIVFALGMKDRYFTHTWQRYLERNFVNTHMPVLKGKQVAFLVSGPLSQNANAREILQGYAETMGAHLVSILSDETRDSEKIDAMICSLAEDMERGAREMVVRPHTFLGDGGKKIFRDDIAGGLRFVFQGDHRYYKKHGMYDFPHKKRGMAVLISALILLSKLPFLRKRVRDNMKTMMLKPYERVLANVEPVRAG